MFRGSNREIGDKAEKRKPLCVSTGHWHNNPPLPSREGNDLCVHRQCVDLCLSCRGQVGHTRAVSVCESGSLSEIKDYEGLEMVPPCCLCIFSCEVILTALLKHPKKKKKLKA